MICYSMERGGKEVAQVVTLDSGKCVVSWPTSVVVYDSEDAARAVHIAHMGGRGEATKFNPILGTGADFRRGQECAALDRCEGCWWASVTSNYDSDELVAFENCEDAESFISGYVAQMQYEISGNWRESLSAWVRDQREAHEQMSARRAIAA